MITPNFFIELLKGASNSSRFLKVLILVGVDISLVFGSLWLAFSLRLGELYQPTDSQWLLFLIAPIIAIPVYVRLGLYRAVIRYIGHRAMLTILYANALVALIWSLVPFYLPNFIQVDLFSPRSMPVIFWMVLCLFIGGSRQVARWIIAEHYRDSERRPVVIYGAGEAGAKLAKSLSDSAEVKLLGFVDDDNALHKHDVAGLKVLGSHDEVAVLKQRYTDLEVLLALPSISGDQRLRILDQLEEQQVAVRSMPSMDDIALGRQPLTQLNDVNIDDILGRESVSPDPELLKKCVFKQAVLVSGAGGSIGSELCRQLIKQKPSTLILLEQSEYQLYSITEELAKVIEFSTLDTEVVSILGTVLDRGLVSKLYRAYHVNVVFHAAAYKHVPIVEHNILAGVRNNVIGSFNMAVEALENHVPHFVLVSTDKAVRPTNVMGATKRMAEMVLQGLQLRPDNQTLFSMVRFGNVLGSSGSVIPLFKEQIKQGGPVTVTHPDITRYFMTIPEAAALVIQAGAMSEGGDLFVLDMGEPIKIADLAKRMIRLSGQKVAENNGAGIPIEFTGLRHGEKLYEELLISADVEGTAHPRIMTANELGPQSDIYDLINELDGYLRNQQVEQARDFLLAHVEGFSSQCGLEDLLWHKMNAENMIH